MKLKKIAIRIYWAMYRLFPRGRREWSLKQGFEGLSQSAREKRATKMKVVHSANEMVKEKKILAFGKKGSVSKSKKSDHEIIQGTRNHHKEELREKKLKITDKGKIKNA